MNKIFIIGTCILVMCSAPPQNDRFKKYVDSFEETSKQRKLNFGLLLNTGIKMTKEEALVYVYDNDSTMLYCKQKIFNMETEKVEGISTELYLPQKCLQIKTRKFIVIGYSAFECQDQNKLLKQSLTLKIIDASNFQVTDSLLVYTGNDYGWEMTGLINPQNNKIFILKQMDAKTTREAYIYKINKNLKFEIEKQQAILRA